MPITPTYPGVYIEEIPSGVRTITGVATSITAFIGRTLRGPTDDPRIINSYADFERIFGGLWVDSSLGYAVRDFYLNGGRQAMIVRLYRQSDGDPTHATLAVDDLNFQARYPGAWGNYLRARVEYSPDEVAEEVAERYELESADLLFNLAVRDTRTGFTEQYQNVTVVESPRRVNRVLEGESRLVRVSGDPPDDRPAQHPDPDPGEDVWGDNAPETNTRVADADQASDGALLDDDAFIGDGKEAAKEGLYALKKADLFNILCIPPYLDDDVDTSVDVIAPAARLCEDSRAMLLVDPPRGWDSVEDAIGGVMGVGTRSRNAALFFPRLRKRNPARDNQTEDFVPCGAVAGIFARTDAARGVWKAPAGLEATLVGVQQLSVPLTDDENGQLNPLGVNCLRAMPAVGPVVWGSRTLQGDDRLASEWKYIPVRRLALFLEESLYRGTQWVVFEPNDEPLWAQIRLNVGAFMQNLFRQGAFQGRSPREAYFVKCDNETTTQNDINLGIVNIIVGFAPLKPAEFVIIRIQQIAGQVEV